MTTTPEWQARFTMLTSSPAPRRNALSPAELQAHPDLALVNRAAAESANLFPESVAIRENYNEFAKIFVEHRLKLATTDRPTADILRDLSAEMTKRVPAK
jgi:multiple sugar transport system substrate-binding protein